MYEDTGKDISQGIMDFLQISLISTKVKVGVVGGGRAALIKAKSFLEKGCRVEALSKDFAEDFKTIADEKLKIIKGVYDKAFIMDKHIVVLALEPGEALEEAIKHCEECHKIYINCSDFKEGMALMPTQYRGENLCFSLHASGGNPRATKMIMGKITEQLEEYNEFIGYITKLRNNAKALEHKESVLSFLASEDFEYFYKKEKERLIITMFFGEEISEKIFGGE